MSYTVRALVMGGIFEVAAVIFLITADVAPMAFMLALTGLAMSVMAFILSHAMRSTGSVHELSLPRWTPAAARTARPAASAPLGVHLPASSLLPIGICLASAVLFFGLAVNLSFATLGVALLGIALIGWLVDSRREWQAVAAADKSGVISNPAPLRVPRLLIDVAAVAFFSLAIAQSGILTPASTTPAISAADPLHPLLGAQGIQFDAPSISVQAGVATELTFSNRDAGIPHNIAIREVGTSGAPLFSGEQLTGIAEIEYQVPALDATKSYEFFCELHANMVGAIELK